MAQHEMQRLLARRGLEIAFPAQGIGLAGVEFAVDQLEGTPRCGSIRLTMHVFGKAAMQVRGETDIEQPVLQTLQDIDTER